ncbi:MAG: asparaginase [Candidatus Paceibacterota bacterium]
MKKRICFIYCGGTIGMVRKGDGLLGPAQNSGDLISLVPGLENLADFGYEFVADIDSTNMHLAIWKKLAQTIFDKYENYDGFVIAHGTDTMAYTASALSFALQNLAKPVVITGAQKPIIDLASDGQNNLINAAKVALLDVPEVCIVFGTKVLRGNRAQKRSESKLNAFWSPVALPIGCIAIEPEIAFDRVIRAQNKDLVLKPDFENEVIFYQIFPGLNGKYIESALDGGCKGIILNSYGAGNIPNGDYSLLPVIKKAVAADIPVVITTQCVEGSARLMYEVGAAALEAGAISVRDMTSEAAATKLMWVLAQTQDMLEIKNIMRQNIAGEISVN